MGQRELDRDKRAAIFAAALEELSSVGFASASVDAIAARSGASKATLYRHWPSKSMLLVEAVTQHTNAPVLAPGQTSFADAVLHALATTSRWARDNAGLFVALIQAAHHDPELAAQTQRLIAQPHDALWNSLAQQWLPAGSESAWLRQVCEGFLLQQILPDAEAPSAEDLATFVADVVQPLYLAHTTT